MIKPWHKRLPNFESFDKIELTVVPRYKTSGLSGDEWRTSVVVKFFFKGEEVHEEGFSQMRYALAYLPARWHEAQQPIPSRVIEIEGDACDQPSCAKRAVVRRRLRKVFSHQGEKLDPSEHISHYYRQFCADHAERGDCSREDSDTNYEAMPNETEQ